MVTSSTITTVEIRDDESLVNFIVEGDSVVIEVFHGESNCVYRKIRTRKELAPLANAIQGPAPVRFAQFPGEFGGRTL